MVDIPYELRYPLVRGWGKLQLLTLVFENIPVGVTELEMEPKPDYMKVIAALQFTAPEPAGPTSNLRVQCWHSAGVGIEEYAECDLRLTHSTVDYMHPFYASMFPEYPMTFRITNSTSDPQTFAVNLVFIGFPKKEGYDAWRNWLLEEHELHKNIEELIEQVKGLRTLLERLRR